MLYQQHTKTRRGFKILSFNIHKGSSWILRKSTIRALRAQIHAVKPDIIFLQESFGDQFEVIAHELFPHTSYGKNAVYTKGHHGNAILSLYPFVSSKNTDISMGPYENRGLLHSVITLDDFDHHIHLLCVHLGLFKKDRDKQIRKIAEYIESIPNNHYVIVAGDFNDWGSHATTPLVDELNFHESFLHYHGEYAKTYPARLPLLKLDRIYSRGFSTTAATCLNHPEWKKLSDHIALKVVLHPKQRHF